MYLGLDLGTSGLRGVLAKADGTIITDAEASLETQHVAPGWSEQDPQSWINACETVMAQLKDKAGDQLAELRAIGMSGHMHGATMIDAADKVVRPCMLWNDTRSATEAAALDGGPIFRGVSGNVVFPGFTAPKVEWVRRHEPDTFARIAKVLLPKDYLRLWLSGEYISEMSDAAGTSWLDVAKRDWSDDALAATSLTRDNMPALVEGTAPAGTLRQALLEEWGLNGPVLIAGGAADNAAAACGIGCLSEGAGFVSLGTSGVLLTGRDSFAPAPETAVHTFCHAVPDRWYQMGVILAATDCLNWLARTLDQDAGALARALPDAIDGPSRLQFLPYLSGERTPHNDANIRGAFIGLDVGIEPQDLTRAVMEGVAFALKDNLEALSATGAQLDTIFAVGGGARSRFWLETLATLLDLPLSLPKSSELGAALGAVRLAICADTNASPEDVMTAPEVAEIIAPRVDLSAAYADAYGRYAQLYPALSPLS